MNNSSPDTAAQALQRAWLIRGPLAIALLPVAGLFGLVAALRRLSFRLGIRHSERLPVPVIVVGNLIAGGAGKTPTVLSLVDALRARGWQPGVISRGHGRVAATVLNVEPDTPADQCGDEPLLLRLRARVPVVVGRDRVAAGRELLRLHPGVNLIVSDDGLQHLRLARDAQLIVFDERGAGNGWLLPAGPLREPLTAQPPARSVVLYNAAVPTTPWPGSTARRSLAGAVALADWWQGVPATHQTLQALTGRPIIAAAGTARPQRFFDMLRAAGIDVAPLALPDHHDYAALPWPADTVDVIVTEKDAVKLDPGRMGTVRIWVAPLDFALAAALVNEIAALLPPPPARNDHGQPTA